MKSILFFLFNCLLIGCNAEAMHPQNDCLDKAYDILKGESLIVGKDVWGFDGVVKSTEQGWAFTVIVKNSKSPCDLFVKLAKSGSYYGLIGLHKLDPALYRASLAEFSGNSTVCLVTGDSFEDVDGAYFLSQYIEKRGSQIFDSMLNDKLPHWSTTVRVRRP